MAAADGDDSLYPIAVLIDELRNEDVQVRRPWGSWGIREGETGARTALAEKAQCSLGVAEGGGGQSAPSSHVSRSPDWMRRRPGLGVSPPEGGRQATLEGSRACQVRAAAPVLEAETREWVGPLGGAEGRARPLGDGGAQLAPSGGGAPGFSGLW